MSEVTRFLMTKERYPVKKLRKTLALAAVLLVALAPALVLAADPAPAAPKTEAQKAAPKTEAEKAAPAAVKAAGPEGFSIYLGVAFGSGMIILGAAYGIGRIGSAAVESMARQPEVADSINKAMIVAAALIEGVTFFALIVCILAILFG